MTAKPLFDELASRVAARPELTSKVGEATVVAQLEIRDDEQQLEFFQLRFASGGVEPRTGQADDATFGILMHVLDLEDLLRGRATLRACLIDGRVEIEGDLGQAMLLVGALFG